MFKHLAAVCVLALFLTGCTDYYKIVDPASGKAYYTTDYDEKRSGAVSFTDDASGSGVTIQNSEVSEISKEAYEEKVGKD